MTPVDTNKLETDVSQFIRSAIDRWSDIHAGDVKAGNRKERANEKLVLRWAKQGNVVPILSELLAHESPEVRLNAASHLLNHGCEEQAVKVLRALTLEPSLIASMASAVLRVRKIPSEDPARDYVVYPSANTGVLR